MKRILSICLLWIGCLTLWGQSSGGGYGGDYNPSNPDNPSMPPSKYRLTVMATEGGTVEPNIVNQKYTEGSGFRLYAYNQPKHRFVHWIQDDSVVVSSSSNFYFSMPAKDVILTAVFEYYPGQYGGGYNPSNPDNPSSTAKSYQLTAKSTPANIGNAHASSSRVNVGEEAYVDASQHSSYKFEGWWLNDVLVSTEPHYRFRMEDHNMDFTAKYTYNPTSPQNPTTNGESLTHTIYYEIDGYTYLTVSSAPGKKITLPATPVRKGYTFKGWTSVPEVMPQGNCRIYGSFSANMYTAKFVVEGKTITRKLAYGTKITPPEMGTLEGYTFRWIDMPTTMPDHDIVINGEYSPVKYAVIYMVDGVEYRRLEYSPGETLIPIPEPTKVGFVFSGWSSMPSAMPNSYLVVNGSFIDPTLNRYQVTYVVNDEVYRVDSIAPGSLIAHLNLPYKEGYTFNITNSLPIYMPTYDLTIEGTFSINSYKLTYVLDGNVYKEVTYEYGAEIDLLEPPVIEGSAFSGWSELPKTMPARNLTLSGSYIINGYTITYILDNEVYKKVVYQYGTSVTPMDNLGKEGYTFSGWSESPETMPARDMTITASFTKNRYTLTYWVDGKVHYTDTLEYATPITPLEELSKEGYTFSGWSEIPETMPAKDVLITSLFTINSYEITYSVDGVAHHKDTIAYGMPIVLAENPTKEGHTFSGWSEAPKLMPANDITITGTFAINSYKATYMVDGTVHQTDTIVYGTEFTAIDDLKKEGYTFSGWTGVPQTMPANDVTITGSFAINSYEITYTVDGVTHHKETLNYGTTIQAIDYPTKEGHTFSGWGDIPQTMPARDVTAAGTFIINKYKITYVVEGKTIHTDSITYNEVITQIEYPEKEGFTFSGWIGIPVIMPANDVTASGEFFIKTTQTDEQGLIYTLNEETQTFEVSNYNDNLVENVVIPSDLYGYTVSGISNRALMGAERLLSVTIPSCIVNVGDRAFYGSLNISHIEWGATAPVDASCFDEPARHGNLLVYVDDKTTKVTYQGNVIIDGVAEKITLTNEQPFRNLRDFTAQSIDFTREFSKKTVIGVTSGWEAIIIPFDVQTVTSENRGELKPFGIADFNTSLPYWTAQLQSDGSFAYIETIKANTPFIMEVPNSDDYEDEYNINGKVTFSATNTTVYATTSTIPPTTEGDYAMSGTYEDIEADSHVYAINDDEYTLNDGTTILPGGIFIANSRDIRPFEAYIYSNKVAQAPYLHIAGRESTNLGMLKSDTLDDDAWYTLQGVRLTGRPQEKGAYIHRSKVEIVR